MIKSGLKLALEGLGVLIATGIVATAGYIVLAQGTGTAHRRTVLLEMSWKRGDVRYGPNFIHPESPCLGNPESGCYCSVDFTATNSVEFADYVESFGSKRVPVKYDVDYGRDRQVRGAVLNSVGAWSAQRFDIIERSLTSGFRMAQNKSASGVIHGNSPSDCFQKSEK